MRQLNDKTNYLTTLTTALLFAAPPVRETDEQKKERKQ